MGTFPAVLTKVRHDHPDFFDDAAKREPPEDERVIDVVDIEIPRPDEFGQSQRDDVPVDLPLQHDRDLWDIEPDEDDFEPDSPQANEERRGFESGRSRVGVELLAVYRPFHFYPDGYWGVHFFERPMAQFAVGLHRQFLLAGRRESPSRVLKMAFYAVARHEFHHYLTELESLALELKQGVRSIYRPYWDNVYKKTYPGADCLEETVASVWAWDNPVIRTPVDVQAIFRKVIRANAFDAY